MRTTIFGLTLLALVFIVPVTTAPTRADADEGMWLLNNAPKSQIKERYAFDLTDTWLRNVQMASVRFNSGGSGSFVSADGLVMTNHHVAADALQKISTPQKDYVKDGFHALAPTDEVKAPDLELNVLASIEDVTARVSGAVKSGMTPAEANLARRAAMAAIEKESLAATGLRSDVVTLYQGGQYHLYRYKKYTDVRLVYAPEFAIAFFGGDPDNFTFPRYDLDVAFFRVYENDQPARVEHHFRWSKAGASDGELVFVPGHPGTTHRLNTVAHLEFSRDVDFPFLIRWLERGRAVRAAYASRGSEQARQAQEGLFGLENSLKAFHGMYAGLRDPVLMKRKAESEQALQRSVEVDTAKRAAYGDAWQAIAAERKQFRSFYREYRFLEAAAGFDSALFQRARLLVRLAAEDAKPNTERLPEYTDARRSSLELGLFSPAPEYPELEKVTLADSLAFLREEFGADHAIVRTVLGGKEPAARAAEVVDGTKLVDADARRKLAAGGLKAIETSTDPMIVLAREIDADARAARKRYESEVQAVERASYAKIAQARFDLEGTRVYPDATFTLRLSYGAVKGYIEEGKMVPPFTDIEGLYARATQHGNRRPYELPESWIRRKSAVNLKTPLNFVSTADIIGGNSGSPVVNRNAEIVGLIFDGNIQSLVGDFVYDETQNRAVAVDSRAIVEALGSVYSVSELVAELRTGVRTKKPE